jgi:3-methyladenine DNA glycosylase AlkC
MGAMDDLIGPEVVARLGTAVRRSARLELPALTAAQDALDGLRLRRRVDLVRDALLSDLPPGFAAVERLVLDLLEDPLLAGWMIWPVTELVTTRALESGSAEDFDSALALLARLTVGLTGEFAIRDLLIARPERALAVMLAWTEHEDEHVRRLATEGSRAFLPWAKRVPWLLAHPRATRAILDSSYRDPSEYVRRSTANHLNDLSRVDPGIVIEIAAGWAAAPDEQTPRVVRHALRTLLKRGDPTALVLAGFDGGVLRVGSPRLSVDVVPWGGSLEISAEVVNEGRTESTVVVDYSIGFQRADGSVRPKTFRLATRRLAAGESTTVARTHSFRELSTRRHYPGPHSVTVQANGVLSPRVDFVLGP